MVITPARSGTAEPEIPGWVHVVSVLAPFFPLSTQTHILFALAHNGAQHDCIV